MFKRSGSQNWHSKVLTQGGYIEVSWRTRDRALAKKMEAMWADLAQKRAWDILNTVVDGHVSVGKLWDDYTANHRSADKLRTSASDVALYTLVEDFLRWYRASGVRTETAAIVEAHVRWLIGFQRDPKTRAWVTFGPTLHLSSMTPAYLTGRLSEYPGAPSTKHRVHFAWSVFAQWMVLNSIISESPLPKVLRPTLLQQPPKFYELEDVKKILTHAPNEEMRALWALMYGSGAEITPALVLTVNEVDPKKKTVRVMATKAKTRDRICRIADWAWPFVESRLVGRTVSHERLWPGLLNRNQAWGAHVTAVKRAGLPNYPLYNARHHWAATRLRAGWPVALVQAQLGHSTPAYTLNVYGRFVPSAADYDLWEKRSSMVESSTGDESEVEKLTSSMVVSGYDSVFRKLDGS